VLTIAEETEMRGPVMMVLLGMSLAIGACNAADHDRAAGADAAATAPGGAAGDEHTPADAGAAHDEHDAAPPGHAATGDAVPLLQIMQKLGSDMASLTHGLMTDDRQLVVNSASAIAEHSAIADLERVQQELGGEIGEFERLDTDVHNTLLQLRDAAAAGRTDEVLTKLNQAQRGCVACHAKFRERLRTNVAS
jgi:cytochrome c556